MTGGVKLLGHSIHPMLIVFPLGLLATGVIFDIIYLINEGTIFSIVAYWMIVAGLISGVIAAIFGFIDWLAIPRNTRAWTIGLLHGAVNAVTLLLFAVSWYIRGSDSVRPPTSAYVASFVGAVVSLVGGWLGGELVERLGVSVHPGANLNATSSLSTSKPVEANRATIPQRS